MPKTDHQECSPPPLQNLPCQVRLQPCPLIPTNVNLIMLANDSLTFKRA